MKEYNVKVDDEGTKYWYLNGVLHREDGPAVEFRKGDKIWYLNGVFHREDGPAIEYASGTKLWYLNGVLHREDGPAYEFADGSKYWYLNGTTYTEEEFWNKVNPGKHLSINLDGFQSVQFQFQPIPVGEIYINGRYRYKPQEDITVLELSLLMRLFIIAVNGGYGYDYMGYIKKHNLQRHFIKM